MCYKEVSVCMSLRLEIYLCVVDRHLICIDIFWYIRILLLTFVSYFEINNCRKILFMDLIRCVNVIFTGRNEVGPR